MNLMALALKGMRPWLWQAMKKSLADQFTKETARQVFKNAGAHFDALVPHLPKEPTLGARTMVLFSASTISTFRALSDAGLDHEDALETTARINWQVYEKQALLFRALPSLTTRDPIKRVDRTMGLLMKFPYSFSGYDMRRVAAGPDMAGFDVHRCPAQEYFKKYGLADLCQHAFCDLDYPLAAAWGVGLDRPKTLASGADFCDFRFTRL